MWDIILFIVLALFSAGLCALGLCVYIVPAGRQRFVRNSWTQRKRTIQQGVNIVWPWEATIVMTLPVGPDPKVVFDSLPADAQTTWTYDPPPYNASTKDQVDAAIDIWIEYMIVNPDAVSNVPNADFARSLENDVLANMQEIVAQLNRKDLQAGTLRRRFAAIEWVAKGGLKITRVDIQRIQFDDATQELLRAQSMGLSAADALTHVERTGFNSAIRTSRNTSMIVSRDDGGRRPPRMVIAETQ